MEFLIFGIIGIGIVILITIAATNIKELYCCDECKKYKLKEISRTETKRERISITKTSRERVKVDNGKWHEITNEYKVPGIRVHYLVDKVCSNCGAQKQVSVYEDFEE